MTELHNIKSRLQSARDSNEINRLLTESKITLSNLGLLIPINDKDLSGLSDARDILEFGALHSISVKDINSFERYVGILQNFYINLNDKLPQSVNHSNILALQLLIYLTQNRISDFHTLIETLPIDLLSNHHIQTPIKVERWLMEGSYSKVWESKDEITNAGQWIWDALMTTIRNEIANCEEKVYDSLPMNDAATLLFFKSQNELAEFAKCQRGWLISPSQHVIFKNDRVQQQHDTKNVIPRENMIHYSLNYARELESII